ncbi:hypothetical protein HHI36_016472 [Cryptolaemus montrouzieri]|uniref:Uncharacterized protein n=1 Tax=Cryptolaemus montrouzieri TaxID=559131 RepID=A0ABD2NK93_9CUCU
METFFEENEKKRKEREESLKKECKTKINPKNRGKTSNKAKKYSPEKRKKRKKTSNKKEIVQRVKKERFGDATDTSEGEDVGSEYSKEDTLCVI